MTGGQSIDLASEGRILSVDELAQMHNLKTGALFRACVISACCLADELSAEKWHALDQFSRQIGLAFQIRDDILDIEGSTNQIGKQQGADLIHEKATYPTLFGMDQARTRADELLEQSLAVLDELHVAADGLHWLAQLIVLRKS